MTVNPAQLVTQASLADAVVLNAQGIVVGPVASDRLGHSGVVEVLGQDRTIPVQVWRARPRASLLYFDPHVAARVGLPVLPGNVVTSEFEHDMVGRFAMRTNGDSRRSSVVLQADYYAQSEGNTGSGRGGLLPTSNIFLKGIGKTPHVTGKANKTHSNGWAAVHVPLIETVWGEVTSHLLSAPSSRTVAVIGLDQMIRSDRKIPFREPATILVRSGLQLRPAHLIEQSVYDAYIKWALVYMQHFRGSMGASAAAAGGYSRFDTETQLTGGTIKPEMVFRALHAIGVLRYHEHEGEIVPDMRATFLELLDMSALISAEMYRWRIMHGAPSAGNLQLDGSLLDVEDMSANPRTGRFLALPYTMPYGWPEFQMRAHNYRLVWESLLLNLSDEEKRAYNLVGLDTPEDWERVYEADYKKHLSAQFLRATGFKPELAGRVAEEQAKLAREYRDVLLQLAELENPGDIPAALEINGKLLPNDEPVRTKAVVDIFNVLRFLPEIYFANPGTNLTDDIVRLLEPIYLGEDKDAQEVEVRHLAEQLDRLYSQIMQSAVRWRGESYDSEEAMRAAVIARAAFENRPLDRLYVWNFRREINQVLADQEHIGDTFMNPAYVTAFMRDRVTDSQRNLEALMRQGEIFEGTDGSLDIAVMTLDHVSTGVRASGEGRSLFVRIPLTEVNNGHQGFSVPMVDGRVASVRKVAQSTLEYSLTDDGSGTQTVTGRIETIGENSFLVFDIPVMASQAGLLRSTVRISGFPEIRPWAYAFAVPDRRDVDQLVAEENARRGGILANLANSVAPVEMSSADEDSRHERDGQGAQGG